MTLLFDNVLTEQEIPSAERQSQSEEEPQVQGVNAELEQEFLPLKKYHLVQRLYALQDKMNFYNIQNSDLNTILQFSKELSYDSIIHLIKGITPFLQQQIKGVDINEKK